MNFDIRYFILTALMTVLPCFCTSAQEVTERVDTLETTVFTARQSGNYLSKGKDIRTEVISSAGLQKMAGARFQSPN